MYPDTWGKSDISFDKFPFQVYYGDGSQIKDEVIQVRFSRFQIPKKQNKKNTIITNVNIK